MALISKKPKKVLIIDDDSAILEALQLTFDSFGYKTNALAKGEEAINEAFKFKPDLIILDVLLSGIDGKVVCKNIKEDPKLKKIPIVMISAHPDVKKSALDAGANDFLEKPFDLDILIKKVEKLTRPTRG